VLIFRKLIVGLPDRHSLSVVGSFRVMTRLVMSPLLLSILHRLIREGFGHTLLLFKSIEEPLK